MGTLANWQPTKQWALFTKDPRDPDEPQFWTCHFESDNGNTVQFNAIRCFGPCYFDVRVYFGGKVFRERFHHTKGGE